MTQLNQIYKCSICGNIVEVAHEGAGTLVCCGKNMDLMTAKSNEEGVEKHLPVIEKSENGLTVKVGSLPHPMEENHYIEWIEIVFDGKVDRQYLKPGQVPEAHFNILAENMVARAYCNVHGLWQN